MDPYKKLKARSKSIYISSSALKQYNDEDEKMQTIEDWVNIVENLKVFSSKKKLKCKS